MKYELAEMEIVAFCSSNDNEKCSGNHSVRTYERIPNSVTKICLLDHQKKIAYNIDNLEEEIPVLEKDENNFIKKGQSIDFYRLYAIKEKTVPKTFDSQVEYWCAKHLLKKRLKRK